MSRRSAAAYYSQIERPIAWCEGLGALRCGNRRARHSNKDKQHLCKTCRAALRESEKIKA